MFDVIWTPFIFKLKMKVQRMAEKTESVSSEMYLNVPKPGM